MPLLNGEEMERKLRELLVRTAEESEFEVSEEGSNKNKES
jgi:hypothetical protein